MGLHPMIDFASGSFDAPGFAPETVLPEQFFRRSGGSSPERHLMLAVLEQALLDLRRSADRRTLRVRRLADEVEGWFAANDDRWPCSFLRVCHALELDVAAVRARLARWRTELPERIVTLRIPGTYPETPAVDRTRAVAAAG